MSEPRKPTLLHRIEHALFSGAVSLSMLAGDRGPDGLGSFIGRLGHFPLRIRRDHVERNLRTAFPDADDAWIRATMRSAYAFLAREALATMRMGRMPREYILDRTTITGMDVLKRALAQGRGVVLVSGHIGNQELGAAALGLRGIPFDVVAQQQSNPLFNAALNQTRRRFGIGVIDRSKASRLAMKALRAGRVVGFAADQNAGRSGIFVPFFGKLASTHRGAALFAIKTGAPVVVATTIRRGNVYALTIEPVDVDRTGELDDVVYRLTAAFTARLEEVVRSAPDQYLWLHRRWKTRPERESPQERNSDKQV
jgi:KDO2-lipid IV(A) lauroyltransferase